MTKPFAKVHAEVRAAEGWERTSSCNGCRRSRSVNQEDPEVVAILNIGSRDERGSGGGSEFRFCNQCMNEVSDTITAGVIDLRLPWRVIGYTAEECERDMRRMSNGERGCANPAEHEFVKDPHMKPRGL